MLLHNIQVKEVNKQSPVDMILTLPKTNIASENGPSQIETSLPTTNFQGGNVNFRAGR